jgi:hypothetical protein
MRTPSSLISQTSKWKIFNRSAMASLAPEGRSSHSAGGIIVQTTAWSPPFQARLTNLASLDTTPHFQILASARFHQTIIEELPTK